MLHINYVTNAIGLIIQDITFLRRLALKEAYILTILYTLGTEISFILNSFS